MVYRHTVETPRLEGSCGVAILINWWKKGQANLILPERLEFYMENVLKWFL